MPEYLAPGVYVEEVSFRSKSIEGVSTTTTGFIGPTRYGPTDLEPDLVTSLGEFERVYGDGQPLKFGDNTTAIPNFMWHAARAFFEEGGKRLYVARIFRTRRDEADQAVVLGTGRATAWLPIDAASSATDPGTIAIEARFPGEAGGMRVRVTAGLGQNVLGINDGRTTTAGLRDGDIVWISDRDNPSAGRPYRVVEFFDQDLSENSYRFSDLATPTPEVLDLKPGSPPDLIPRQHKVQVITLTVTVFPDDPQALTGVWSELPLDPNHERFGVRDSFSELFSARPATLAQARSLPIIVTLGAGRQTGLAVLDALDGATGGTLMAALADPDSADDDRSIDLRLTGGDDGDRPTAKEYEGDARFDQNFTTGLKSLELIEDISIVAAPGSTFQNPPPDTRYEVQVAANLNLLISHAQRMRYRIAVLDSGNAQTIQDVRATRAKIDSTYAALYYPWVKIVDPISGKEADMPPSGFVAGIYARNDINRAVYKAPANEVVNLAIGFERTLNKAHQDVLNPEGVNCFRFFEGRGFRLWGARTISSDPEWKYVNLRRYFIYLEHSIDKGTQWAVFEPNGDQLWANVRRTIEDFLLNEWQMGALLGDKPEKAFFVRCDRSTMTQNDLDNGRLVCKIGVAPLRPAEFVIFRIGQWTADRRV